MAFDLIQAWERVVAHEDSAPPMRYAGVLRDFLVWYEAHTHEPFDPQRLTSLDLTSYRAHRQALGHSPSTLNVAVCAASPPGWWRAASATRMWPGASRWSASRPLAPAAVDAPLCAAQRGRQAARNQALVQRLLQTGLRIGECAALRLGDVSIRARAGRLIVRAGKGNTARSVPLNAAARAALVRYLAVRWGVEDALDAVLAAWAGQDPAAPLWVSQKGGRLHVRSLAKMLDKLVANCARRGLVPPTPAPTRCGTPSPRSTSAAGPMTWWAWPPCWATPAWRPRGSTSSQPGWPG